MYPVPVASRPVAVARALFVFVGLTSTFGSIYFSVVDPPQAVHGADWLVAAWAFANGIAALFLAVRLRADDAGLLRAARALIAVHAAFGLVKLFVYAESASFTFLAIDVALAVLLTRPGTNTVEPARA